MNDQTTRRSLRIGGRAMVVMALVAAVVALQGSAFAQAQKTTYKFNYHFTPANSKLHESSILTSAQKFLVDQRTQTAATRQRVTQARASGASGSDCTGAPVFHAPGGALSFNRDPCDMLQSEESVTYVQDGYNMAVGGVNDFGGFFGFNAQNSLSGYSVAAHTGGTPGTTNIVKSGDMPGVLDPSCTDGSVLSAFGDPSLSETDYNGVTFYSSLADPLNVAVANCATTNGDNGVVLSRGNHNLFNTAVACNDGVTSSNCWTSVLVAQANVSGCPTSTSPCQFLDKEYTAADNNASSPHQGNVYVAYDVIDVSGETGWIVGCDNGLDACSAPVEYSALSGTNNEFSPSVAVRRDGSVEVGYEAFDTPTGSVTFRVARLTVGSSGSTPTLTVASDTPVASISQSDLTQVDYVQGMQTNGLRILTQFKIAVDDTTSVNTGYTYGTWEECAANYNYYGFLCGHVQIHMVAMATPTSTGVTLPFLASSYDEFMPTIAVDSVTGTPYVAYYSTKTDLVHSGIRLFITRSGGGTGGFVSPYVLTQALDSYQADTCVQLGCAPQFGDYMQMAVVGGHPWIHFNSNYEQKGGPSSQWGVNGLVNQEDNYLCYMPSFPPSNPTFPCS